VDSGKKKASGKLRARNRDGFKGNKHLLIVKKVRNKWISIGKRMDFMRHDVSYMGTAYTEFTGLKRRNHGENAQFWLDDPIKSKS
jgi:hypothetical protein